MNFGDGASRRGEKYIHKTRVGHLSPKTCKLGPYQLFFWSKWFGPGLDFQTNGLGGSNTKVLIFTQIPKPNLQLPFLISTLSERTRGASISHFLPLFRHTCEAETPNGLRSRSRPGSRH
ncbi:hypothetical protein RchiOBHm_Chr1g0378311 [Rosa chinensis]|uniref:Uncharacterized protein n=1 Tax=Rosa chinensis TaxID=74649 RepID=A0A2P6SND8_ROSCH|nr:hypothetical protein RchiOBHm_Chr1g0378311 [Rosa chinensis]